MGFDEIVAHADDVVDTKLRGGMGVEHRRLVDVFLFQGQRGFDGDEVDVDVGAVEGGELFGEGADMASLYAVDIDQAGDFHNAVGGQVGDESVIEDIAADLVGGVGLDGVDDARAVLV